MRKFLIAVVIAMVIALLPIGIMGAITNQSSGSGGTVTSVGLSLPSEITVSNSPVTSSGNLTGVWASETAKTFLAAPNAANGTPSFRTIAASDIPTLNQSTSGTAAGLSAILVPSSGGTGIANNVASTLTISGSYASTFTVTNTTTITLPTTGTLATLAGTETFTNKTLTSPKLNEDVALTSTSTKLNLLASAAGSTGTNTYNLVFSNSPIFSGTVYLPDSLFIGITQMTSTATQLNYLNAVTGTTGTTSSNLVFSASPTFTGTTALPTVTTTGTITMPNSVGIYMTDNAATDKKVLWMDNVGSFRVDSPKAKLYINNAIATNMQFWGGTAGTTMALVLQSSSATSGATTMNSPTLTLNAQYWNGAANTAWPFSIINTMTATTPASTTSFSINSVNILQLTNTNTAPSILLPLTPLSMSQVASEPASTADRAGIYAIDLSAAHCTLGINTEQAVAADIGIASTNSLNVRINGATYKIPLVLVP